MKNNHTLHLIKFIFILILMTLINMTGCRSYFDKNLNKIIPIEYDKIARSVILASYEQRLEDEIRKQLKLGPNYQMRKQFLEQIQKFQNSTSSSNIVEIKPISFFSRHRHSLNSNNNEVEDVYIIDYQIQHIDDWQFVEIKLIIKSNELYDILWVHTNLPDNLINLNKFSLAEKTPQHYLNLTMIMAYYSVILYALVKIYRMKSLERKWLWALVATLGVIEFNFNWTTGALFIKIFSFYYEK